MNKFVNQPKTKRGQATLDRLCSAAEDLFYSQGYYATSINDITSKAQVAPGTFYIYFSDKINIYKHLLVNYSHQIRMHIALRIKESSVTTRKEAERIGLRSFLEFIAEHKSMYNIIWESLYIDKRLFVEYYTDFAKNYAMHIEEAIGKGQMKDYDPEVVAFMLMGISNFLGLNWIMFSDRGDVDHAVDEVMKILEEGLF
jgi:AcrR family transcriptional regulator